MTSRVRRRGLAAALAVACFGPAPAQAARVVYAVAIGVNQPPAPAAGDPALARLRYADDDAVRYFQLFERFAADARLLAVLDPTTQRRYPGLARRASAPTLANLASVTAGWARRMAADRARGDEPVLYFAFSGHGVRGPDGTFSLALLDGGITRQLLHDRILAALPAAMVHLFVDACHAGGVVGVRGDGPFARELEGTAAPVSETEMDALLGATSLVRFPAVGALLASSVGEEAHEWSVVESGVFTHELLSALHGAADVNRDRRIEYSEVEAFIASANRAIRDPRALPRVVARPPALDRNALLIDLDDLAGGVRLEGDASPLGHFYIELDSGQRLLDAHLAAGLSTALALPPGATAFVRTATLEALVRGGRAGTVRFAAPYGRSYYEGYVDSTGASRVDFAADAVLAARAPEPHGAGRRRLAIGLAGAAGAALVTSAATGIAALAAKRDFDRTDRQRQAYAARDRFERYAAISTVSAAAALGAGLAAWLLWPNPAVTLEPDLGPGGTGASLVVGGRW
jgi:hypothetical protein